jgi:hypothetical protein
MSKFKNIFSLSNIENADSFEPCSEMSGHGAHHDCKHGHILCSICHGSVHAHGNLSMRNHKREDTYKEDSGYFMVSHTENSMCVDTSMTNTAKDMTMLAIVMCPMTRHFRTRFKAICVLNITQ